MYTTKLKNDVIEKLLDCDKTSINKWIYRNSYIQTNNLQSLLDDILQATNQIQTDRLDERIYAILNDIFDAPTCYCGTTVKFKRFRLGYAQYCSVKCRANDMEWQQQVATTNIERYGVSHIAKLPDEIEKRRQQFILVDRTTWNTHKQSVSRKKTIESRYGINYNSGWTDSAIQKRIDNGHMVPIELLGEYREYYDSVVRITNKQDLSQLENIEKRGILGKDQDAHHVDHIVSIYDGFMNDVPPNVIGHLSNLQCIPGKQNIEKGNDSWMSINNLYERYNIVCQN